MGKKTIDVVSQAVLHRAMKIVPPVNYHQGLHLPSSLELPDNILCFFHNFPSRELQHNRYCIVVPFDPLIYILNGIPHRVAPGTIITQRPYAAHGIRAIDGQCRRVQISFVLKANPDYFPDEEFTPVGGDCLRIVNHLLQMFMENEVTECAFDVYRLCKKLSDKVSKNNRAQSPELKAKVEDITEFRRERRENIKSIASRLDISESNLRLRFRKENGQSLGRFLQQRKLEGARYRLQFTRQTIVEISMVCGYDSVASFSRFFKKQTGLSPSQWRKQYQKQIVHE